MSREKKASGREYSLRFDNIGEPNYLLIHSCNREVILPIAVTSLDLMSISLLLFLALLKKPEKYTDENVMKFCAAYQIKKIHLCLYANILFSDPVKNVRTNKTIMMLLLYIKRLQSNRCNGNL